MDKVKVNNQIVSMRKFVKQAKIHAINKCTKQIKFLENRKGNEEQVAKSKRKHQRLLEEVNLLKKIKPDTVSKLALSKAKDWKVVLAEKNVPLEDRCFAMLANHPPVQEAVEKFLDDNNELITKIPELVKEWEGKKSRSSQINKKKQKGNKNNANDPNTLPIGKRDNFNKSGDVQISHKNTESLENLTNNSNVENLQNDIIGQNSAIGEATKRERSFDIVHSISSPNKKQLAVDGEESCASDDNLSDDSESPNHQNIQINQKLSVEGEKSYQPNEQSKSYLTNNQTNLTNQNLATKKKVPFNNLNHANSPVKKELSVKEDEESYASDHSFSDNSDSANHQKSKQKLSVKGQINSQSKKNLMYSINQTNSAKKMPLKEKAIDTNEIKSNKGEYSEKPQDIISKFLEISKTVGKNKPRNKSTIIHRQPNTNSDSDAESSSGAVNNSSDILNFSSPKTKPSSSKKPENKNKIKAVAMLDFNQLQDVDEIPIEKSDSDVEEETDEDSGKLKKDSFFLRDGEPVSDSDEDKNVEIERGRKHDFPNFKKRPYDDFRERKDNSFQRRRFEKHSVNERNSNFREKSFVRNKREFPFKDNKRNFSQSFDNNSDSRQNKNFKLASKDNFNKRNGANSFSKNPKENSFSKNNNRDRKGNSFHSNPNLSNLPKKDQADDKPLHPSWEAKRKLKEAANTKFQGKRMVFND